jgi:hypothetical protein
MSEGIVPRPRRPDHEFQIRPSTTSDAAQPEPISPELALVDPELRSEALRKLPVGGGARSEPESRADGRAGGSGVSAPPSPAAHVEIAARRVPGPPVAVGDKTRVEELRASRRHPWRRRTAIVALAIVMGAVGVALALRFPPQHVSRGMSQREAQADKDVTQLQTTRVQTAGQAQTSAKPPSKHSATPARKRSATRPTKRSAKTRRPPRSSRVASGARTHKPRPRLRSAHDLKSKRPPATPLTRLFVWPAVKHAAYYKVEFFRRGRPVFEAWPAAPRIQLPLQWTYKGRSMRIEPGAYSWQVSPAFGTRSRPRYGVPIVRSTWIART